MRVISGSAGRLKLKTPATMDVRPTTDRIKETLFNILNPYIYGCRFLDLFAGSGGIGIESLSRGAELAVFADNYQESLRCIRDNLESTRLASKAKVYPGDCVNLISRFAAEGLSFDIIFMDPPYNKSLEEAVLREIAKHPILAPDGMIIVEASSATEFGYLDEIGMHITREKSYGSNKHIFITF